MKRIPMKSGDEYDALTSWRKVLHWRAGERARIKRHYRRRERRINARWDALLATPESQSFLAEMADRILQEYGR
jgi:hypothetical protein